MAVAITVGPDVPECLNMSQVIWVSIDV